MNPTNVFRALIVLEGLDGSGKDTLLTSLLPKFYEEGNSGKVFLSKYQKVARTREPTHSSSQGKWLIEKLELGTLGAESPELVSKNYIADRVEHSAEIRYLLSAGYLVLTSRYDLSTYAYQGSQGLSFDSLYSAHQYGERGALIPGLTILIDVSAETALARIEKRATHLEFFEKKEWLEKTRTKYLEAVDLLRQKDGREILVISGECSKEELLEKVETALSDFFKK